MGKKTGQNANAKGGLIKLIITIFSVIIVAIASLLGIGGAASDEQEYDVAEVISAEDVYEDVSDEESETVSEAISEEPANGSEQTSEAASEQISEEVSVEENSEELEEADVTVAEITFRSQKLLDQHFDKHGIEMGFASAEEYELAAYKVTIHPDTLHKIESEDGDDVYYREETNEFVVVSQDGYIRTYFNPSAGIDYYNRQ